MITTGFINFLFIWGIHKLCGEGQIIGQFLSQKYSKLTAPIYICVPCMSSIWGSAGFLFTYQLENLHYLPIYLICLCGALEISCRIIKKPDYTDILNTMIE